MSHDKTTRLLQIPGSPYSDFQYILTLYIYVIFVINIINIDNKYIERVNKA